MIGKTALALVAAALIAATAALFVGAAGIALFTWLDKPLGDTLAAAATAGFALLFLIIMLLIASWPKNGHKAAHAAPRSQVHSLITMFSDTIKDRPLLTLGLTALTGIAATRDPNLLKDLWTAVLHHHDDET